MKQINVEQMRQLSRQQSMSLGNTEKDYALSVALTRLPSLTNQAVFKGGTCIKKCYYPQFRFSSDLDFTYQDTDLKTLKTKIQENFQMKTIEGVRFQKVKPIETLKNNLILGIQYISEVSQTGYIDSIRVEYSTETPIQNDTPIRTVINPHEYELPKSSLPCLSLEEIFAEKIHALYHRRKARDLYDAAFLLSQGVNVDHKLIAAKLKPLKIELDKNTIEEKIARLKEIWNDDMARLLLNVPNVNESEKILLSGLFKK